MRYYIAICLVMAIACAMATQGGFLGFLIGVGVGVGVLVLAPLGAFIVFGLLFCSGEKAVS